ncbi:glycoside hydrolase family 2 protein [Nocardioides pacificus]
MLTRWGRSLDADAPLPEYPRPQLVRERWLNLNGRWDYAIVSGAGPAALAGPQPASYDGVIVVPFSPEAPLSGVGRTLGADETLWYRRSVTLPHDLVPSAGERVLLHFGAVDQVCRVFVGGVDVGGHDGGYLPFTLDVTSSFSGASVELVVAVQDETDAGHRSRGKQRTKRGGIWYTPFSGIWQTVWLEVVPATYVERLTLVPDLATSSLEVTVHAGGAASDGAEAAGACIELIADGEIVTSTLAPVGSPVTLPVPEPRLWSPEDPYLYDVRVRLGRDEVTSYVGMRSFGVALDGAGVPRLLLNGLPYFQAGVLDQGWWPDGLCTPPSDEAMVFDIETMKRLGFTMLRKHIKIEPLRWYAHCDRLGMIVWQDMVNGGSAYRPRVITLPAVAPGARLRDTGRRGHRAFGRADAAGRASYEIEARETVEHLRNVTSLAVWVPFNEGWGQFDAERIAAEIATLDPTRSVDHASGWHDQGGGHLLSLHVYFRRFRLPPMVRHRLEPRALVLSEYGGYGLAVEGHTWGAKKFGYRRFRSAKALARVFTALHRRQLAPTVPAGLSATVYTQLSDVEDEINGLVTYDREVVKLEESVVRSALTPLTHP